MARAISNRQGALPPKRAQLFVGLIFVWSVFSACSGQADTNPSQENNPLASVLSPNGFVVNLDADYQIELGDAIQRCVQADGFGYEPVPPETNPEYEVGIEDAPERGLGISTQFFDEEFLGDDLLGAPIGTGENPNRVVETSDNDSYAAGLSPSEQESYYETVERCEIAALDEIGGEGSFLSDEDSLEKAAEEILDRYRNNDLVIGEANRISDCMTQAGFEFGSELEVVDYLRSRIQDELLPLVYSPVKSQAEFQEVGPEDTNRPDEPEQIRPSADFLGMLEDVQQEELALSQALVDCNGLHSQRPKELVDLESEIVASVTDNYFG